MGTLCSVVPYLAYFPETNTLSTAMLDDPEEVELSFFLQDNDIEKRKRIMGKDFFILWENRG